MNYLQSRGLCCGMKLDPKDCLFVAVDVQNHFYAANQPQLRAAVALHNRLAWFNIPTFQLYMTHKTIKDRQAKLDHYMRPMLPVAPAHSYAKTNEAPEVDSDFAHALSDAAPAAVMLFGCYFEQCLKKSAQLCHRVLEDAGVASSVFIIDDCSLSISNGRYSRSDRQRLLGANITLIDRASLQLSSDAVGLLAGDTKMQPFSSTASTMRHPSKITLRP